MNEIVDLLEFCAGYDHRHITDEEAEAWHKAIGHLDLDDAKVAVVDYYTTQTERIRPAHVYRRCQPPAVPPPVPARVGVASAVGGQHAAEAVQLAARARADNQARRARVLRHPDLARKLTEAPLGYPQPEQWTGFVPPAEGQDEAPESVHSGAGQPNRKGRRTGATRANTSERRKALVSICAEAWRREQQQETGGAA